MALRDDHGKKKRILTQLDQTASETTIHPQRFPGRPDKKGGQFLAA
jgi:hypothetical protein